MEENIKKGKTFKEMCEDPEFKKRHYEYIKTYVDCPECGKSVQRCAMARHRKSRQHMKIVDMENEKSGKLRKMIEDEIQVLKTKLEDIIKTRNVE